MSARAAAVAGALVSTVAVAFFGGAASASTSVVPKAMVGCWHRHVPALPVGTTAGVWLIKITRGGKLAAYSPGTTTCGAIFDFTTNIVVAGSHLTVGSVPICAAKGNYTWKAAANTLTLAVTADKSCSSRALLFTGAWKKT